MPSCTEVEKSGTVETTIKLNYYKDSIPYSAGVDWLLRASAADGVFAGPSLVLPRWVGASLDRGKRARGQMRRSTGLAVWSWNHGAHFVSWIGTSRPNSLLSGELHGAGPFGVGRTFGSHGCISAALERVLLCKGKTGGARRTYTLRRRYSWQRPSEQVPHPAWAPALWPKNRTGTARASPQIHLGEREGRTCKVRRPSPPPQLCWGRYFPTYTLRRHIGKLRLPRTLPAPWSPIFGSSAS